MMDINTDPVKLTHYSHGAGCGCKISPQVLEAILKDSTGTPVNEHLLVGNQSRDDAAVYDLDNGTALIATTDFFMPIVDNPYDFGRIAAANAISDVYAMGGKPVLAIAILGWPVNLLSAAIAQQVMEGGRSICREAGIPLAGGHSIDCPEPIFGLAVNGLVSIGHLKRNNTARTGDLLYLTKPLGVGILTTAEKKGLLKPGHAGLAARQMMQLNKVGEALGRIEGVTAMTDVTGFGLLGHLCEMAEGSSLGAGIFLDKIPFIVEDLTDYIDREAVPGGTNRNWQSYGHKIAGTNDYTRVLLADPQTSGGLLIAVNPRARMEVETVLQEIEPATGAEPIGQLTEKKSFVINIS